MTNNNSNNKSSTVERKANNLCPWCKSSDAVIKEGIFSCTRCSYQIDIITPPEIKVIGWTTGKDKDHLCIECRTTDIYNAIVKEVKENGYSFSWGLHQSDSLPCMPVINNGNKIGCSPTTWGAIMADAHASENSYDAVYAEYAFGFVDNPVYPKKNVDYHLIVPFEINGNDN